MRDKLLTFYCATADTDVIVSALRAETRSPVHVRREQVFGHDFGDARTVEQVHGSLARSAISLFVAQAEINGLAVAVTGARRALPVRWHAVPVSIGGRIE